MQLKNEVMLITYADSMGNNLKDLHKVLNQYYANAVGGVHILPFFPSSADRGFAPMCYDRVDPNFGTFADVEAIGKDYYLMFDFMVNHISAHSAYFQDFLQKKDQSAYKDFFIRYSDFWENGEPTQEQVDLIYKRKHVLRTSKQNLQTAAKKKSGARSAKNKLIWMYEKMLPSSSSSKHWWICAIMVRPSFVWMHLLMRLRNRIPVVSL